MGFLLIGGEQAVYEALDTSRVPLRPGERLDALLGEDKAGGFLRFVLRAASEGLRRGRSAFLVRDEIRAELLHFLEAAEQSTLAVAVDHAALMVELAMAARDAFDLAQQGDQAALARLAGRGRRWEHRADELVNQARELARRWPRAEALLRLLATSDDVADDLEEAVFLLTLPLGEAGRPVADAFRALADEVVRGAEAYLRALECARALQQGRSREDLEDFLAVLDEVVAAEHTADEVGRRTTALVFTQASDFRQLSLLAEVGRRLEGATDSLMHAALTLREQVLGGAAT